MVVDAAKKPTARYIKTQPGGIPFFLQSIYNLFQIVTPDFESTRVGLIALIECQDEKMESGRGDWALIQEIWTIVMNYPMKLKQMKHFHSGLGANLLVSGLKRFLPKSFKEKFEMGCSTGAGTLDSMFLQPTLEAAMDRLLRRFEACLRKRFYHEATFKL
ncbi:expressed unknown protein [Seminavis robusta]|uniref:Uncharacterized protein n=1 Tax=Seminavis robusta TaxID=568900 RepID=A0A9N8HCX0_9STRA|nr:expressed unknown protein [Seminavis robusta]|eukprot:Sro320_g116450.1 n/a (160) ;mRNA; r:15309-15788